MNAPSGAHKRREAHFTVVKPDAPSALPGAAQSDAVRPLILTGWAAALPKIGIVVIIMAVFDSVCLWGAARAFRRTLG